MSAVDAGGCAPPIQIDEAPAMRIVISVNHFPLEVLSEGSTTADAKARCDQLTADHREKPGVHISRLFSFSTVPVREVAP